MATATCLTINAQSTTGTAEPRVPGEIATTSTVPSFRHTAVSPATGAAGKPTVVFFGERPKWVPDGKQPAVRDIITTSSQLLGAAVVDATVAEESVVETAKRVASVISSRPTAVILYTGRTDDRKSTPDEQVQKALTSIVDSIRQQNIQAFIVPSSTGVGAGVSGRMRVVATTSNAIYVEPGTESGGRPFEEALEEVKSQLQAAVPGGPLTASTGTTLGTTGSAGAISTPANLSPAGEQGQFTAGPAETPVTIHMQPAPVLKSFDPREAVKKGRPTPARKQPAISQ